MGDEVKGFAKLLIERGVITRDMLVDAQQTARTTSAEVSDTLVKLGYATADEVMRAVAAEHGLDYVDLSQEDVSNDVIELMPESVARENVVLPYQVDGGTLTVLISNPGDVDTMEKLRFILNRDIRISLAPRPAILEAINRLYGQVEGESADSILQEFTDTAIDFTETVDEDINDSEMIDESSAPIVRLVNLMIT